MTGFCVFLILCAVAPHLAVLVAIGYVALVGWTLIVD
jgi:hypothetical protein